VYDPDEDLEDEEEGKSTKSKSSTRVSRKRGPKKDAPPTTSKEKKQTTKLPKKTSGEEIGKENKSIKEAEPSKERKGSGAFDLNLSLS
jgi:hypothetical protein